MKVLHLAMTLDDGAGIAAWRQHLSLVAAGVGSRFAVAAPAAPARPDVVAIPPARPSFLRRACRRLGVFPDQAARWREQLRQAASRGPAAFELFSLPFSNFRIEDHPALAGADIVNLHWVSGFVDFPRFFRKLRKPLVWTLHDQQPYLGGFHYDTDAEANPALAPLEQACRSLKRRALSGHRLAAVGNSDWNTALARSSGMFPPATSFRTILYPLDTEACRPVERRAARTALGLPADAFLVGFACTSLDNRRKGLADLLEALRRLAGETQPLALVSFGRAPASGTVASMPHPWTHLGFLDGDQAKAAAYSAMDCFVAPSRAEAFGQTAIEALACGTPVIAASAGGLREAVGDGGLLFPPGDVDALAAAIRELAADPARRAALARTGRDRVLRRHSPPACAAAYLEVYRALLDKAAAGP